MEANQKLQKRVNVLEEEAVKNRLLRWTDQCKPLFTDYFCPALLTEITHKTISQNSNPSFQLLKFLPFPYNLNKSKILIMRCMIWKTELQEKFYKRESGEIF